MDALLDNPIWSALTTTNAAFAEGDSSAKRYPSDMSPFAAVSRESSLSFEALAALAEPGARLALTSWSPLVAPDTFAIEMQKPIVQMVMNGAAQSRAAKPEHVALTEADVEDILDLAERTKPGPFGRRTIDFGGYIGIRIDGKLVAMAGERMQCGPFVEISAVCVDPAHRGKGYAGLLMLRLAQRIQEKRATPFLHAFADNVGAIALYEKLGFVVRCKMVMNVLRRV